jgi:hypothetical protein
MTQSESKLVADLRQAIRTRDLALDVLIKALEKHHAELKEHGDGGCHVCGRTWDPEVTP